MNVCPFAMSPQDNVFPLGKDFQGKKLKVSMARRKPMMGMMRGGMPMRGDRGGMMGRGGNASLEATEKVSVFLY